MVPGQDLSSLVPRLYFLAAPNTTGQNQVGLFSNSKIGSPEPTPNSKHLTLRLACVSSLHPRSWPIVA